MSAARVPPPSLFWFSTEGRVPRGARGSIPGSGSGSGSQEWPGPEGEEEEEGPGPGSQAWLTSLAGTKDSDAARLGVGVLCSSCTSAALASLLRRSSLTCSAVVFLACCGVIPPKANLFLLSLVSGLWCSGLLRKLFTTLGFGFAFAQCVAAGSGQSLSSRLKLASGDAAMGGMLGMCSLWRLGASVELWGC